MKVILYSTLAMCAIVAGASNALAEDRCDVMSFKDEIAYTKDIETNLAYLGKVSESKQSSADGSAALSVMDLFSVGAGDSKKASSQLERMLQINYSQSDRQWLLVSALSPTGQKAYVECLKNRKDSFSIVLSSGAAFKKKFFVVVNSHPVSVVQDPQPLDIRPLGGKILGKTPGSIRNQGKVIFAVVRDDLYEPFELAISVGNDSLTPPISLPGLPRKELVRELRKIEAPGEMYGGRDMSTPLLCITLANDEQDAFIVPKSITLTQRIEIQHDGVIEEVARQDTDMREQCISVRFRSTSDGRIKGTAIATATVIRAIPIPGAQKGAPAAKASDNH